MKRGAGSAVSSDSATLNGQVRPMIFHLLRQAVALQAKSLIVYQQLSLLGSMNLDYRSIEYNCEPSLVLRSAEFGRQMAALFEHDVRFADPIRLGEWRGRPWLDRIGQRAVSRARYLL